MMTEILTMILTAFGIVLVGLFGFGVGYAKCERDQERQKERDRQDELETRLERIESRKPR